MNQALLDLLMTYRPMAQMFVMKVLPEIERRRRQGLLTKKGLLHVHRYQVLLPRSGDAIVRINDEVKLTATTVPTRSIVAGEELTIADIDPEQTFLELPQIDGKRVAFFLTQSFFLSRLNLFDFSPNGPDGPSPGPMKYPVRFISTAKGLQEALKPEAALKALKTDNWPPGRMFFPRVLDLIAAGTAVGSPEFVDAVAAAYSPEMWGLWCDFWGEIKAFPSRLIYVRHAADRYFAADYISAVRVIVPEFEAVMREHLTLSGKTPPGNPGRVIIEFRKLIKSRPVVLFSPELVETVLQFIETELLRGTQVVHAPLEQVNRHGLLHGVFAGSETKEMALKYLVLLDALALIIFHDRLVTDRMS